MICTIVFGLINCTFQNDYIPCASISTVFLWPRDGISTYTIFNFQCALVLPFHEIFNIFDNIYMQSWLSQIICNWHHAPNSLQSKNTSIRAIRTFSTMLMCIELTENYGLESGWCGDSGSYRRTLGFSITSNPEPPELGDGLVCNEPGSLIWMV